MEPLRADGYQIVRWPQSFDFARVHGIEIATGILHGGADPGSDGVALGV